MELIGGESRCRRWVDEVDGEVGWRRWVEDVDGGGRWRRWMEEEGGGDGWRKGVEAGRLKRWVQAKGRSWVCSEELPGQHEVGGSCH